MGPWALSEGCPVAILRGVYLVGERSRGPVLKDVQQAFLEECSLMFIESFLPRAGERVASLGRCGRKKGSALPVVAGRESERLFWKKAGGASVSLFQDY